MSQRPAAFVDRDGTIIRDANYIRDPGEVELLSGAAAALRRLNESGVAVVVVTNQSGIARGLITGENYEAVQQRLSELLAAEGARVDAVYMCPHHPDVNGPCDCRKPGLALYRQAIAEHELDGRQSLFVGDRMRDVTPASSFGGRGVLLDVPSTPEEDRARARSESVATARSLADAVDGFLRALPTATRRQ